MRIDILTIFPGMFAGPFAEGMVAKAVVDGRCSVAVHDLRRWAEGRHRVTDDYAFGGGPGMVMKPEPFFAAAAELAGPGCRTVLLSPQGRLLDQALAAELASAPQLLLLCGRYEGVDERVRLRLCDEEVSIGDFVLTGGELPAMILVDAVVRLLPGVLAAGAAESDSFATGLLEGPQYTRPREFGGMAVPDVLISGDHAAVGRWRREQALLRTLRRRPDLLETAPLTEEDRRALACLRRQLAEDDPGQGPIDRSGPEGGAGESGRNAGTGARGDDAGPGASGRDTGTGATGDDGGRGASGSDAGDGGAPGPQR